MNAATKHHAGPHRWGRSRSTGRFTRRLATWASLLTLGWGSHASGQSPWEPSRLEIPSPQRADYLLDRPPTPTFSPLGTDSGDATYDVAFRLFAAERAANRVDRPEGASPAASTQTPPPTESGTTPIAHRPPAASPGVTHVPYDNSLFGPGPQYTQPYQSELAESPYGGKYPVPTQRPWVEWFRGMYLPGPIPPSTGLFGETNPTAPHFLVYGDWRNAVGYTAQGGEERGVAGTRLNLDFDLKLTGTERIHAFLGPLDRGLNVTRWELRRGELDFFEEFDSDFDTFFFEGDMGALWGGMTGQDSPFDLPFTVGYIPLLFQNGIWMEDAFLGAAVSLAARNNPTWDWPNYDLTFFVGWDELNSGAFPDDDSAAQVYGANWFLEAYGGYFEIGYARLDDQVGTDRSYHNAAIGYTRRILNLASCSLRYLTNFGQDGDGTRQTADGHLILFESSLITSHPSTCVPYMNLFAGFDRPQSVARAGVSGGVLRNTGINFETDGITGFPTLDATANNTYGGALGLELLGPFFDHQIVLELATVQTMGNRADRSVAGDEYGVGVRYQIPINHAWLWRMDAMHGILEDADDVTGARVELRHKF